MDINSIIINGTSGILGVAFHCCLKYTSLKKQATAANLKFNVGNYVSQDLVGIIMSFLSVGIWFICSKEIFAQYPKVEGLEHTSFAVMGILGSYLIQYFTSRASKKITNVIDTKTNIADDKVVGDTPSDTSLQN